MSYYFFYRNLLKNKKIFYKFLIYFSWSILSKSAHYVSGLHICAARIETAKINGLGKLILRAIEIFGFQKYILNFRSMR